jgi:hypothetical protein
MMIQFLCLCLRTIFSLQHSRYKIKCHIGDVYELIQVLILSKQSLDGLFLNLIILAYNKHYLICISC